MPVDLSEATLEGKSGLIDLWNGKRSTVREPDGQLAMTHRFTSASPLHHAALKTKQRSLREGFPLPLTLRVHRALSWLTRAEQEEDDGDVRFILLWVGFNAAYAINIEQEAHSERGRFQAFFATLIGLDNAHRIYDMVWERFSNEIRLLLDNRHVFAPFWAHQNGEAGYADWEQRLQRSRNSVAKALREHDTVRILSILFDRLYVLRNQLVHGGATWNSDVNREQVRDGASLLGCLLPVFIDLMMDHPGQVWRMPHYPVVED